MFKIKKVSLSNKTIRMPDSLIENLEHLAVKNDILFSEREHAPHRRNLDG